MVAALKCSACVESRSFVRGISLKFPPYDTSSHITSPPSLYFLAAHYVLKHIITKRNYHFRPKAETVHLPGGNHFCCLQYHCLSDLLRPLAEFIRFLGGVFCSLNYIQAKDGPVMKAIFLLNSCLCPFICRPLFNFAAARYSLGSSETDRQTSLSEASSFSWMPGRPCCTCGQSSLSS